jgi:ketosteroid isomerase-like protein
VPTNAERVHGAMAAWNEGGLRALSDNWWSDDILWHDMPNLPDPQVSSGKAAAEARVNEMVAVLGHWRFEVRSVEELGPDKTLAELGLVGEGAASGAAFMGTVHQICRWRDGLTAEVITFADRESALASNAR